jgi:hypothetical protein
LRALPPTYTGGSPKSHSMLMGFEDKG